MFTTNVFVQANNAELRKKFSDLGYTFCSPYDDKNALNNLRTEVEINPIVRQTIHLSTADAVVTINCKNNVDAALAIAALRDDSDIYQWFTDGSEFVLCTNDSWEEFIKSLKVFQYKKDNLSFHFRKATAPEIFRWFDQGLIENMYFDDLVMPYISDAVTSSREYKIRERLNNGKKLSKSDRLFLTDAVNFGSDKNGVNKDGRAGLHFIKWFFDFSDVLKIYVVRVGRTIHLLLATDTKVLKQVISENSYIYDLATVISKRGVSIKSFCKQYKISNYGLFSSRLSR